MGNNLSVIGAPWPLIRGEIVKELCQKFVLGTSRVNRNE